MDEMDWTEGAWQASGAPQCTVAVCADWAPFRKFEQLMLSALDSVYGDVLPVLRRADLRIVNVECALSDAGTPILKGGTEIKSPPAAVGALTAVPFEVACLANNHTCDCGPEGLREAIERLREAGIRHVGAGMCEADAVAPLIVEASGVRLGIVNFCEGEDCTGAHGGPGTFDWDVERAAAIVGKLRTDVDVVLAIAHAGREHTPLPPPYLVRAYRRIAEAGAHAVIGHHPHVPQGIEFHGGVPILYSLGNFAFYQDVPFFYRKSGYVAEFQLRRGGLTGLRLTPYLIAPEGLRPMGKELRSWFFKRLRRVSERLEDAASVRAAWEAFIDRLGPGELPLRLHDLHGMFEQDARVGAAKVRNSFITPAHRWFWIDAATRLVEGQYGTAPDWARALVEEWCTLSVEDGLAMPA
jgi:poly-gamma-glutamate synthesis protein (capsule biosynthesis protein)